MNVSNQPQTRLKLGVAETLRRTESPNVDEKASNKTRISVFSGSAPLAKRAVLLLMRNPASIAGAVVFPILFFLMFNLTMRNIMKARGFDYAQLLPATIVIQAMFFTAMSSSYYVAADRGSGIHDRFRSNPISRLAPMLGRAAGDLSRAALSTLILLVVSMIFGMRFQTGPAGAVGFVAVSLCFAFVLSQGMGIFGLIAKTPEAAMAMGQIIYLPSLMLSTGFAPVDDFPIWMQAFIRNQPVSRTIDLLRALTVGGPTTRPAMLFLVWMIVLISVFSIVVIRVSRGRHA